MNKTTIAPYRRLDLKVYGYTLPDLATHEGCVKVGETQNEVKDRILQQTATAGLRAKLLFQRNAVRSDGRLFHDRDLHAYYQLRGIPRAILNEHASEWFKFGDLSLAEELTDDYIVSDYSEVQVSAEHSDYILREEQARAVEDTIEYWCEPTHGAEFLWNAKPRFGKTLTTYDFMRKIEAKNVLIVTNRPAIANSWYDDFEKFIAWQEEGFKFVSETDALKDRPTMSRQNFLEYVNADVDEKINIRCLAFISLQDLKGAKFAGGIYDKLQWVADMDWDLLVVDEAHEGIDTLKTDRAFEKIKTKFTLHLSGTPFKALANKKFHSEQIFNWSYLDEQNAKAEWDETQADTNPYAALPTLSLFTYQMSKLIAKEVAGGIQLDEETNVDYAFDLNEFFSTKEDGSFVYEADVDKFLDNLSSGKFPFAEQEHRSELAHSFWLLDRVSSVKALQKKLQAHPFFNTYEIVLAAGDGISLPDEENIEDEDSSAYNTKNIGLSFNRVREAIANNEKTITLSVGQLTTGVTIPEWTAVLMLSNIKSPARYFQAAFRAQNPYEFQNPDTGEWFRKENAYVFDFAPDRTLILFDEFANNLTDEGLKGSENERKENIRKLINFFPVIAEDDEGEMIELSPDQVLTFPSRIKASEVVKRGFMSNLLFANISGIFSAPALVKEILSKIAPEKNKRLAEKRELEPTNPMLDDQGNVQIPQTLTINTANNLFGEKIYQAIDLEEVLEQVKDFDNREKASTKVAKEIIKTIEPKFEKVKEEFGLKKKHIVIDVKKAEEILATKVEENLYQKQEKERLAEVNYQEELKKPESHALREQITEDYQAKKQEIQAEFVADLQESIEQTTQEVVQPHLVQREETKKKTTEDDVRDHLRGFARTIPAFLMAYGTSETTLATYDDNIDPQTFEELTSITLDEFRKLRDGFDYVDEQGNNKSFKGLFDEVVFNASVVEFFNIKDRLADYLQSEKDEDIFNYIPPQQTNQIFTPKRVVKMMVDLLEEHDPDIFKNKEITFIDLYSKSGLFLSEVAKRLFSGLAEQIPDEKERIKWILERQVFGCAPSNIIYNMVKNYLYGGYPELRTDNLLELDLVEAAKAGKVAKVLEESMGRKMKFDVIIGNPPYQEKTEGTSDNPIYHYFMIEAYKLAEKVCFITPARFLFDAGKTPKAWNKLMLNDPYLKVVFFEEDSSKVFPGNVEIKGGVAITIRDIKDEYGPLGFFTQNPLLNSIIKKMKYNNSVSIIDQIFLQSKLNLEILLQDRSDLLQFIGSGGKERRLTTNIFSVLDIFSIEKEQEDDLLVLGLINNLRVYRYVPLKYIDPNANTYFYKVIIPKSSGSGTFGEELANPMIGTPGFTFTQSFISIGRFETKNEAEALYKYIKTKFARTLLGSLKVTQDNNTATWRNVPNQDFTANSDIDWNQPVHEIDRQLYKKYNLDDEEIAFIESMIRPMD